MKRINSLRKSIYVVGIVSLVLAFSLSILTFFSKSEALYMWFARFAVFSSFWGFTSGIIFKDKKLISSISGVTVFWILVLSS